MRVHVGATLDRLPGPKYLAALSFCELELTPPLPRVATAAKWREAMPGPVELSLLAPRPCVVGPRGPLRIDDDALGDAVEWLADTAAALDATWVVVRTPPTVSPGPRSRERLSAYFDRVVGELGARRLVWAPSGPWEADEAQRFGAARGVVVAVDPLQADPLPSAELYCRLAAAGGRPRFGEGVLEALLDRLEELGVEEARVALESPRSFQEAQRLRALADAREA